MILRKDPTAQAQLSTRSGMLALRAAYLFWVGILGLTAILILYPARLQYGASAVAVDTTEIFSNLLVFAILFNSWAAVLIGLLIGGLESGRPWRNLALVNLFALVFWGFWILLTPYGASFDSVYNVGIVRSILDSGRVARGSPNLAYLDYPALHLVASSLSWVGGLTDFQAALILRLVNAQLVSSLVFLIFSKLVRSYVLGGLGTVLFIENIPSQVSTIPGSAIFFPSSFAFTLLLVLVVVTLRQRVAPTGQISRPSELLVSFFLVTAAIVMHFVTSAAMILFLISEYLVARVRGVTRGQNLHAAVLLGVILFFLAWLVGWTVVTFPNIAENVRHRVTFSFISAAWRGGVAVLPSWGAATRLAWLGVTGAAILVGIYNTIRVLRLETAAECLEVSGFLGMAVLAAVGGLVSVDGSQVIRLLYLGPVFAFPMVLRKFDRLLPRFRASAVVALAVFLGLLSFPSFLLSQNNIATTTAYDHDMAAGRFAHAHYGNGDGLRIYGIASGATTPIYDYYTPNAANLSFAQYTPGLDFFVKFSRLLDLMRYSRLGTRVAIFISSSKTAPLLEKMGIPADMAQWAATRARPREWNLLYTNGAVQMYEQGAR